MDERNSILIAISAAVACNCLPCFDYWWGKAQEVGIDPEEVNQVAELAGKVKNGAALAIRKKVSACLAGEAGGEIFQPDPGQRACCCS